MQVNQINWIKKTQSKLFHRKSRSFNNRDVRHLKFIEHSLDFIFLQSVIVLNINLLQTISESAFGYSFNYIFETRRSWYPVWFSLFDMCTSTSCKAQELDFVFDRNTEIKFSRTVDVAIKKVWVFLSWRQTWWSVLAQILLFQNILNKFLLRLTSLPLK